MQSVKYFLDEYGIKPGQVIWMILIVAFLGWMAYNVVTGIAVAYGNPPDYIPYLHMPLKWFVQFVS